MVLVQHHTVVNVTCSCPCGVHGGKCGESQRPASGNKCGLHAIVMTTVIIANNMGNFELSLWAAPGKVSAQSWLAGWCHVVSTNQPVLRIVLTLVVRGKTQKCTWAQKFQAPCRFQGNHICLFYQLHGGHYAVMTWKHFSHLLERP